MQTDSIFYILEISDVLFILRPYALHTVPYVRFLQWQHQQTVQR